MGKSNANDIETLIANERTKIKESNVELDTLTQEKYKLEAGTRKLAADVGPIKSIAEFVYDRKADGALIEKEVTWLIILIIFVFDPFAVFLLIAAQHSFDKYRDETKPVQDDFDYERMTPKPEPDVVLKDPEPEDPLKEYAPDTPVTSNDTTPD